MNRKIIRAQFCKAFLKKHWLMFVVSLLIITAGVLGLYWLSGGIIVIAVSYKLLEKICFSIKQLFFRKAANNLLIGIYVIICSVGLNLFVAEVYQIPSVSMENTLLTGDIILVNKLVYGPKLITDFTEISWFKFLFGNTKAKQPHHHVRATGISAIKQGDVILANLYDNYIIVKRCVAAAGDTLYIKNGDINVNGKKYNSPITVKEKYKVFISSTKEYKKMLETEYGAPGLYQYDIKAQAITGHFSKAEISRFRGGYACRIAKLIDNGQNNKELFAASATTNWNLDNMGPFVVPKKGQTIHLTTENYAVYQKIIGNSGDTAITGYGPQKTYTFKNDYYFLMGDNRKKAMDSRFFGFIADEQIIGKAQLIIFSNDDDQFHWNRLLRLVY